MKALLIVVAIIIIAVSVIPWIYSISKVIQFDANCGDYLRLASDANTIDLAEKHLAVALKYLEDTGRTSGYTKIFVYKPSNDLGLWYENLKSAHEQLVAMQEEGYTELEQSNMLMKLRETICTEEGALVHPMGISMVHNFTLMFWLNMLLWIPCTIIGGILLSVAVDSYY